VCHGYFSAQIVPRRGGRSKISSHPPGPKKSENEGLLIWTVKISLSNLFGRRAGGVRLMLPWRAAATKLIIYGS